MLDSISQWQEPLDALLSAAGWNTYINGMPILQAYFRTMLHDRTIGFMDRMPQFNFRVDEVIEQFESSELGAHIVRFLRDYRLQDHELHPKTEQEAPPISAKANEPTRPSGIGTFWSEDDAPALDQWIQWKEEAQQNPYSFPAAVNIANKGRNFFTTSDGYMGVGPPYARPGDKICIIQGANLPFLVRPEKDGYLLVGEIFVLGLMDGEYKGPFEDIELL